MTTLDELRNVRQEKLERLRAAGIEPYPARSGRTHAIGAVRGDFEAFESAGEPITVAGRLRAVREHGQTVFADLEDGTGKIQLVLKTDVLAEPLLADFRATYDIGDFAEATGKPVTTKTGEQSIEATRLGILTKSLRPLPEKWHGLQDHEERFRRRYLDLVMNPEIRDRFRVRSRIIQALRDALLSEGFEEVETPILQLIPGGASARPFTTRLNALDLNLYLRISPELYLKRLLVGGYEKVFEIGRNFRNEGMDRDHNPEFTMLELYWAYQDYRGLIGFTKKLLAPWLPQPWGEITFAELFRKHTGTDWRAVPADELDQRYKAEVRTANKIERTTLVTDYPEIIMQLAKPKADDPRLTESFQIIAGAQDTGMAGCPEIVKGFSELNDPIFQREQMERQERAYRAGNKEASRLDEDFIEALEYGMPPSAGLGLGIDRLVALATKSGGIREGMPFPLMRPK